MEKTFARRLGAFATEYKTGTESSMQIICLVVLSLWPKANLMTRDALFAQFGIVGCARRRGPSPVCGMNLPLLE